MKKTESFSIVEMAQAMGVTVESLARLPLVKVIEIVNNWREGTKCMTRFEHDIILNNLEKVNAKESEPNI